MAAWISSSSGASSGRALQRSTLPRIQLAPGSSRSFATVSAGHGLGHRLWSHPLGRGQVRHASRPAAVEPSENGAMRQGEPVLRAQAAEQLAEDGPQLAGDESRIGLGGHVGSLLAWRVEKLYR